MEPSACSPRRGGAGRPGRGPGRAPSTGFEGPEAEHPILARPLGRGPPHLLPSQSPPCLPEAQALPSASSPPGALFASYWRVAEPTSPARPSCRGRRKEASRCPGGWVGTRTQEDALQPGASSGPRAAADLRLSATPQRADAKACADLGAHAAGPYPVSSSASSSRHSSEPGLPGASAMVLAVRVSCSSGRFLGRPSRSPHPQPGFTSPFRLQVEVWKASGLGLGCCFLICCCKRREKNTSRQEALSKLQGPGGPGGRGEAEVQGVGAGTPHRSHPPTRRPGLEVQLCLAGVPKQGARSRSLSLHVKRGDLPGWCLLCALPEHGPLSRLSGHRLAHPSLVPALQTSRTQPELLCPQMPPHPPPCLLTVFFTFLNCWGLSAAPGLCQRPWPGTRD